METTYSCLLVCIGNDNNELGISKEQHGQVVRVDGRVEDEVLRITFPSVRALSDGKIGVGSAADVVGFVLKYGSGTPELQTIYKSADIKPLQCCQCGRVRVCGNQCWCN